MSNACLIYYQDYLFFPDASKVYAVIKWWKLK